MIIIVGKIQDKGEDRFIIIENGKSFKIYDLKTKNYNDNSFSSISEATDSIEKMTNEDYLSEFNEIKNQKIETSPKVEVEPEREKKIEEIFEKIHELFDDYYIHKDYTVFNHVPLWELLMLYHNQIIALKRLYRSKLYESLVLKNKHDLYMILYGILHDEGSVTGEHHHFDFFSQENLFPFKITFSSNRLPEGITKNMFGGGNDEQIGKEYLMSLRSEDFEGVYNRVMKKLNPYNWMHI